MEVFLPHLPAHLTDQGLKAQLAHFTKALDIHDWACQKPRKKSFGSITFLDPKDGQRFLQQYGQPFQGPSYNRDPHDKARLVILNSEVHCRRSNRAPDPFCLRSLSKSAKDRRKAEQDMNRHRDAKVTFTAHSLSCGYYDYVNHELIYSPEVEWLTMRGLAKFAKAALIIEYDSNEYKIRVEIPYRIVEAMTISMNPTALTLTLWEAPSFFKIVSPEIIEMMQSLSLNKKPLTTKSRLNELPGGSSNHHEVLAQTLVYRISISSTEFDIMLEKLHNRGVLTMYHCNVPEVPLHERRSLMAGLRDFNNSIQQCTKSVPFDVLYQMEALVKNGFLLPWVVQELLKKMTKIFQDNVHIKGSSKWLPISARAVKKLFSQIPFPGPEIEASVFTVSELWKYLEENEKELRQDFVKELISLKGRQTLTMIHKVNITPTGMTLHGPDPEAKNRILRRFPNHNEYFIRVQFCDEDGTDLQFNPRTSNEQIFVHFKHVFERGISIGGRVFGFLGFSHSSLRSHSAWFMASFFHEGKLQSYFSVISHLGKFDNIHSPARCAARIGQAFSETPLAISLIENTVKQCIVPDITSRDRSRVFSDGVGTISPSVMEAIHTAIPQRKDAPTCFQIRWGGAKGMLALDARLEGNIMRVRPSMVKFESNDNTNLEICDMANKPIPMVLNRQMIKILEDMGVSDNWFIIQQAQAISTLQLITAHIANTVGFLKRQRIADHIGFPQLIRRLDSMGVDYRADRFMSSVVEAAVLRELRLLKNKARIPVKEGVTLFGILDETEYLDEGEVYVTFDDALFIRNHAVDLDNRRMIITRSPALHPGDIQLATNIIPPEHHPLRELRNCIVFSQKGKRDLPSCLSGGDLDGDTYGIIWDDHAVRDCTHVFEPADYPRVEPLDIGRVVEREDMSDFFIQFMATDQLGLIAVKHMILADQRKTGTADQDCKLLAQMHSTGVDYSKTGIPVDMALLRKIKMNKERPDFLAPAPPANIKNKTEICFDTSTAPFLDEEDEDDGGGAPRFDYYESDKINGKLYRAVDEKRIWYQNIKISKNFTGYVWDNLIEHINIECNTKLGGVRWVEVEQEAWEIRHAYEDAIWNATLECSDHAAKRITELEVFTGSIFNKSGAQTRRQRDRSIRLKDEFDRITQWAEAMIRKKGTKVSGDANKEQQLSADPGGALVLSIACLNVGIAKERQSARLGSGRSEEQFQSFKIIAACCAVRELDAAINRKLTTAGSNGL